MRYLRTALKLLLWLFALLVTVFLYATFFGRSEHRYKCGGSVAGGGDSSAKVVYLKLQLVKPWMFWVNSGGAAWSEIPNAELEHYSKVRRGGDFIYFSTSDDKRTGSFSTLSHAIRIDTRDGMFEGACKRTEPDA